MSDTTESNVDSVEIKKYIRRPGLLVAYVEYVEKILQEHQIAHQSIEEFEVQYKPQRGRKKTKSLTETEDPVLPEVNAVETAESPKKEEIIQQEESESESSSDSEERNKIQLFMKENTDDFTRGFAIVASSSDEEQNEELDSIIKYYDESYLLDSEDEVIDINRMFEKKGSYRRQMKKTYSVQSLQKERESSMSSSEEEDNYEDNYESLNINSPFMYGFDIDKCNKSKSYMILQRRKEGTRSLHYTRLLQFLEDGNVYTGYNLSCFHVGLTGRRGLKRSAVIQYSDDEGVGEEGELLDEYQENEVDSDSNMDTLRDRLDSVNEIDEEMKDFIEPETDNYLMNHQIKHELHPLYYSSTMKVNENLKEKERIEEMLLTSTMIPLLTTNQIQLLTSNQKTNALTAFSGVASIQINRTHKIKCFQCDKQFDYQHLSLDVNKTYIPCPYCSLFIPLPTFIQYNRQLSPKIEEKEFSSDRRILRSCYSILKEVINNIVRQQKREIEEYNKQQRRNKREEEKRIKTEQREKLLYERKLKKEKELEEMKIRKAEKRNETIKNWLYEQIRKIENRLTGARLTLKDAIDTGVFKPGKGVLTMVYMDVKYVADLLPDGRIMDPATNEVYTSPSIYSCTIKKRINPSKTTDDGWRCIKYHNKTIDYYKGLIYSRLSTQMNLPPARSLSAPEPETETETDACYESDTEKDVETDTELTMEEEKTSVKNEHIDDSLNSESNCYGTLQLRIPIRIHHHQYQIQPLQYSTKQLSKYKLECYVYSPTEKKWISRTFQTKPFADTKRKSKGASQGIDVFNNENTPSKQRYYLYDEHGNYYTFQTHSILLQLKDAFIHHFTSTNVLTMENPSTKKQYQVQICQYHSLSPFFVPIITRKKIDDHLYELIRKNGYLKGVNNSYDYYYYLESELKEKTDHIRNKSNLMDTNILSLIPQIEDHFYFVHYLNDPTKVNEYDYICEDVILNGCLKNGKSQFNNWECAFCTFMNPFYYNQCKVCRAEKVTSDIFYDEQETESSASVVETQKKQNNSPKKNRMKRKSITQQETKRKKKN